MRKETIARTSRPRLRRRWGLLAAAVAIPALLAGAVLAFMFATTDPVENDFVPQTAPQIAAKETFSTGDLIKKDVYVSLEDTGYACYVRAKVVVTWQDADGNVYGQLPQEGTDYTIAYGSGWKQIGDFWYYQTPVADKTGDLVETCQVLKQAPTDDCTLHVEILAQAVQSLPETAVEELWGVTPEQLAAS